MTVSMLCALKEKAFVYENLFFVRVVSRYHVTSKYPLFISLANVQKISEMYTQFFLYYFSWKIKDEGILVKGGRR
jgi:hypothetical protein